MPLSALSFVLASKKSEITCLQQLLEMGRLVGAVSQLIHVLQRERGTANIFLCSHGELWAEQLSERALQVQLAERAVDDRLQTLDLSGQSMTNAPRLFSRIAAVLHSLSTLPLLRRQIQAQEIGQPEAMRQFNDVIRTHLALIFEAADISGDPPISRALLAMFSFMQGKELAGQERATGAAGFAARRFDEAAQQHSLDLIEGQERCLQTFSEFADARCLALWQQQLNADSSEFERLRRIACTRATPADNGGDTALRWFEVTTARIDGMKGVEDLLEDVLMACCRQRIDDAQASLAMQQQDIGEIPPHEPHYSALIPPQLSRSVLELVEQQSRQLQAMDTELAGLRATLAERKLVERAKGLLMQHHGMTEPQAHKILRDMAMNQNRKLSDVAEAMLAMSAVLGKKSN
ncbi:nitrate- and nitrite sensing domain-containing protein [Erwinia sp. S43]|uniref:nitrate regulatory protein n=1 Tax=Erwinia sp. S43 TaxID=2769339 RepID=UPI00190D62E2|nr:nitrate regulatory protein [Erwinia sp. S43]MBK0034632.1 nitrate- and nitrite sensing domain-containing protein [Erwinia sp. S43]